MRFQRFLSEAYHFPGFRPRPSVRLISISIRGHKGKLGRQGKKPGENSGQAANCRAEIGFRAAESPAIRCLPRGLRFALEIGLVVRHTSTRRAAGRHADGLLPTLGIIAVSGRGRTAEHGVRKGPSPCIVRFPDGAGCDRRRADL